MTASRRFGSLLALVAGAPVALSQVTATYVGPTNGSWNVPGNWNVGAVPANNGTLYNAIIPASLIVNFDMPAPTTITGLSLASGSTIRLAEGMQLTVSGVSVFAGIVQATGAGARFAANSPFAGFQAGARGFADAGATVRLGGQSYSISGTNWANGDIFHAVGASTLLDLSQLNSITANFGGCCGSNTNRFRAASEGYVDLRNVTTITGATDDEWLQMIEETAGTLNLTNLRTVSGRIQWYPRNTTYTLPLLESATSQQFLLEAAGREFHVPALTTADNCLVSIADGAMFDAPNLRLFTNSEVNLNPARTFIVPPLVNFNGSRIRVVGGTVFAVAAPTYTISTWFNADILSADGVGSRLDLRSLNSFAGAYGGCCGSNQNTVRAIRGGEVDLSNVTAVSGASDDEWLVFSQHDTARIKLDRLRTSTGRVQYLCRESSWTLPALQSASAAYFDADVFDTLTLPVITSMDGCTINIQDGGAVVAPVLTSFTNSVLNLTPNRFFSAPRFTDINRSRLSVADGATLVVAAPSYSINTWYNADILKADGVGSVLDLSSIASFAAAYGGCCGSNQNTVAARNGGLVNLSGLQTVSGASDDEWMYFTATGGGRITFGGVTNTAGRTAFVANASNSRLEFGSLTLRGTGQIDLQLVAQAWVRGNFSYTATDEDWIKLGDGKMVLVGSGSNTDPQTLEVGGADLGMPFGSIAPNFQIGQLTIGQPARPTVALLVDDVNNGNRGAGDPAPPELLYLQGFPAEDGLRLIAGSTLYLNNIEAYAVINNQWVRLRSLIPAGQTCVDYDQGRICIGTPPICIADMDDGSGTGTPDGGVTIDDLLYYLAQYTDGLGRADVDDGSGTGTPDGGVTIDDLLYYIFRFEAGC